MDPLTLYLTYVREATSLVRSLGMILGHLHTCLLHSV